MIHCQSFSFLFGAHSMSDRVRGELWANSCSCSCVCVCVCVCERERERERQRQREKDRQTREREREAEISEGVWCVYENQTMCRASLSCWLVVTTAA